MAALRLRLDYPAALFDALAEAGITTAHAVFAGRRVDTLLAFAGDARRDIPAWDLDCTGPAGSERMALWKAIRQLADDVILSQPLPWPDDASGAVILDVGLRSIEVVELVGEFRGFDTLEDYDAADRFTLSADDAARLRAFEVLCAGPAVD